MDESGFVEEMKERGLQVSLWENGPGFTYSAHTHGYGKILCCLSGSITFHTEGGDMNLVEGDRFSLDAGVRHSATVGASGVRCAEAHVYRP